MLTVREQPFADVCQSMLRQTQAPGARSRARSGLLALALEVLPTSLFLSKPAILCPLADPPRYRVPLFGVTAVEAIAALRPLAPASVPVTEVASSYAPQ